MNANENARREKEIFEAALEATSAAERAAYLKGACGSDTALRRRIDALLHAHDEAGAFLATRTPTRTTIAMPVTEAKGDRIGRYKLREKIGEGGCGVVYVADQEEPVRRRVALKVIKLGMDSNSVVARFEAERQALAMMDHPNIARVLDAGTTDSGRPYFVMELVRGVRITDYCDQNKLTTRARLDLFVKVCQAVQHAHQKGIIHRDLKPSNILVTLHDGVPVPKVIDFGIAKATEGRLSDMTVYTELHQFMGTPAYVSPEQAEMSGLDVDTRADIYSLGVLLYELLTGKTPFDATELLQAGFDEMRRTIREQEPARPSMRLSTMIAAELTTTAGRHGADAPKFISFIRGDLDWIVMKCLEKDRSRRYETANGLAADLKRHLNNEPVVARPPSAAYKFQKAWRRNKLVFAAGTAVAGALLIGITISTWQARRARLAQREAETARLAEQQGRLEVQQQRDVATSAKTEAEVARRKSQAEAYAADISLAERALAENNLGHARQLLARHRPAPGQADRRGWEWRYLWQQARGDAPLRLFTETNGFANLESSPDGRWLSVMGTFGNTIHILDLTDPHRPSIVAEPPSGPMNLRQAFSPVEPQLAYAVSEIRFSTNTCQVHLWDLPARTNVASLPLPGPCVGLKFSRDGQRLVTLSGHQDDTRSELTVWNAHTGAAVNRRPAFAGFRDSASVFDANPELSLVAYVGSSNTLQVMDVTSGTLVWITGPGSGSNFWATAISPDGQALVAVAGPQNQRGEIVLHRWELATGRPIGEPLSASVPTIDVLRFLPDGKTLATAGSEHAMRLWDLSDAQTIRAKGAPWLGSESAIFSITSLPDGKTLLTGSGYGAVLRWDVSAERREPTQGVLKDVRQWWWGPDNQSVFVVERTNQVVQRRGPHFEARTDVLELPDGQNGFPYFSGDCRLLVTTSTNGVLHLWDLQRRTHVQAFGSHSSAVWVEAFLPQRKKVIVRELASQNLEEWDLDTSQMTKLVASGGGDNICVSRDEGWLLKTEYAGRFSLVNLATQETTTRQLPIGQVTAARFSEDGRRFAASSYLGYVGVWETDTLRQLGTFGNRGMPMKMYDLGSDGTRLVTDGAPDDGLQLWDVETQRALISFPQGGRGGGFSLDGNMLGFWVGGSTVHLYRPPSLAEIDALEAKEEAERQQP